MAGINCTRCGHDKKSTLMEEHHIIERIKGGNDDPENKEWRCMACHKYEHAKRKILATLKNERKRGQIERVKVLEHRLAVLVELNTVELIKERGTYQSYWEDETSHYYPPYISKNKRIQNQLAMEIDG